MSFYVSLKSIVRNKSRLLGVEKLRKGRSYCKKSSANASKPEFKC